MENSPDQPRWRLSLLDRWQLVAAHDEPVDVPQREQRLLGLLALRGRRGRDYVAGVLWPDSDGARARANLRGALWWLHHHLPGIVTDGAGCLGLGPAVSVDLAEVRSHLGLDGRPSPVAGSPAVIDALSFDELLPGWEEAWVAEERTLLHQLRLRALEVSVEIALEHDDVVVALLAATRAASLDPFRETARRALIRVHVREGNYADALRVYESFAGVLRCELGVRVSAEMQRLVAPLRWSADDAVTLQ